mmetsp:Transcript_52974/g.78535  ORF Transcript_52974/g.78535 Transcript_52974/m.78535 type:complete len:370 (+) Transcript_52974:337-1446(+)
MASTLQPFDEMSYLSEIIGAMMKQENSRYVCIDYLSKQPLQVELLPKIQADPTSSENLCTSPSSSSHCVNKIWREMVSKWSYRVVDHFGIEREIVSVSMSYLDRFNSVRLQVNDKTVFQLAAITCLYIATKLYAPRFIDMAALLDATRGELSLEHIYVMENFILDDLSWNMHPPTPHCFLQKFLTLIPKINKENSKLHQEILDKSIFFIESSVHDYFFVTRKPSSIVIASILNAIDAISMSVSGSDSSQLYCTKTEFITNVNMVLPNFNIHSNVEITDCLKRLRRKVCHTNLEMKEQKESGDWQIPQFCPRNALPTEEQAIRSENASPTCVSGNLNPNKIEMQGSCERPFKKRKTFTSAIPSICNQGKL